MKSFLLIAISIFVNYTYSGFEQAPESFIVKNKKAVFIDFTKAHYSITYNPRDKKAYVKTKINFIQFEEGYPLFDLVNRPTKVSINSKEVKAKLIRFPKKVSKMRMIKKQLMPGNHILEIESELTRGLKFRQRRRWSSVSSAFFIRDLTDRKFLEQYIPTNLEFDQFKMTMEVKIINTKRTHSLFVNGAKKEIKKNHYFVEFPEHYTTSSLYYHLVPINKFVRWYSTYKSIDGREIPFTIYSRYRFYNYFMRKKARRVLKELERDYGPWPHDQILIYGRGIKGGMEYSGATETSIVSLGHELQHAYFAKGLQPANGNTGWLDEAIASWRDEGHKTLKQPFYKKANLGAKSQYTRKTDKRSYKYGRSFLGYIDYLLKKEGKKGLKEFLRIFSEKRMHTTITNSDFKSDLEAYAGRGFDIEFSRYIYGLKDGVKESDDADKNFKDSYHHPQLDSKSLKSII